MAAVAVWTVLSLPPRPLALDTSWSDGALPGLIHIHTNRSDGLSHPEVVAAAAARAGLKFIVFTDHGDGVRTPDPPMYRSGVLCLDGVEVSTTGGHYAVLGLGATPYPLGGEPRDVVEDVERLGGFGIAAHPDSPKTELAWRDWSVPIDGLEVVNPDTAWRVHVYEGGLAHRVGLVGALFTYMFRPSETIGSLLTPSTDAKARWSRLLIDRPIVGLAGVDAHANVALANTEPGDSRFSLPFPGYEASFRALSVRVTPTGPMTGDATVDAARVMAAIRQGQAYTAIDSWASPPSLFFSASSAAGSVVNQGGTIAPAESLALHIRHNGGDGFVTSVWHGDAAVAEDRTERALTLPIGSTVGAYRVEVRDPRHPDGPAWITSNPIYVRPATAIPVVAPSRPSAGSRPDDHADLFDGRTPTGWTIENDGTSLSAVNVVTTTAGSELRMRYGLSGGPNTGQFAGIAVDTLNGVGAFDRLTFSARAEHPMRVSVQVRAEVRGAPPERWQRSVYLDGTERTRSIFFDDMTAVGETHSARPPTATVRNIMFIVDTTNSLPGSSGSVWLRNVRVER